MEQTHKGITKYVTLLTISGVAAVAYAVITGELALSLIVAILPCVLSYAYMALNMPIVFWLSILCVNYFIMGVLRYVNFTGVSVIMDGLLLSLLLLIAIHSVIHKNIHWKNLNCILVYGCLVWLIFCFLELFNPTGMVSAWVGSRSLMFCGLLVSIVTLLVFTKREYLHWFINVLSILTFFAILKAFMQKFIGFDRAEQLWLDAGGAKTHIIYSGIRYFSFFTDASNMGSCMAFASFFFGVVMLYTKSNFLKVWYAVVASLSFYVLLLSGTRGSMIVILAGIAAYTVLVKNIPLMLTSAVGLLLFYVFFAFTMIGQGNPQIRRMRTAFRPTEDASFMVRMVNQEKLAKHLEGKWFGEGLGLSGVENKRYSVRLTTIIPNDSWLVKIWVETGVVGITLYLSILCAIFLRASYIVMGKVKERQLRGIYIAIIGGSFGLLCSSYGNSFFGQYPSHYIFYMCLAMVMNYKYLENNPEPELNT